MDLTQPHSPGAPEALEDPGWLLGDLLVLRRELVFVRVTRADYRRIDFLYPDRIARHEACSVPAEAAASWLRARSPSAASGWIFHHGYCCSTLLTRILDALGGALVLREPWVLLKLSALRRDFVVVEEGGGPSLLHLALALLRRTYSPAEVPLIKASSSCTDLLPEVLRMDGARAIFLYAPLRDHLCQVLKDPDRRRLLRQRAAALRGAPEELGGPGDIDCRDDAECAAYVWLVHMQRYAYTARLAGGEHLRALPADRLLESTEAAVWATAEHLGVSPLRRPWLEEACRATLARDAKRPDVPFAAAARRQQLAKVAGDHAAELALAGAWIDRVLERWPLPLMLPNPLLGPNTAPVNASVSPAAEPRRMPGGSS